jgi:hypothetical protein
VTLGLVLDPGAMVAYARGSEAIGELIILLAEEDRAVALPAVALADAFGRCDDGEHAMLRVLAGASSSLVVPLDQADAAAVGVLGRRVGLGTAHAVTVAVGFDSYFATVDPTAVRGLLDEDLIIEI